MKSYLRYSSIVTIHYHPIFFFILLIFSLFLISCSSSEETGKEKQKEDEIYIFDEVPPEDAYTLEKPVNNEVSLYIIQIGAFSTRESAEFFAEMSSKNLNREVTVSFNDEVKLFVVRLEERFSSKTEAEIVRANLWQMEEYNDAWIIPIKQKND